MDNDLYRHAGFLRTIARALLHEFHAADDVVHDAYMDVLARGGRFSRAYLSVAVKHKALKWLRSRRRAVVRERLVARPEATVRGDPGELARQAELQRQVAHAVAGLEPAYRDVLLLRYYHELAPSEIAKRTGEPVGTIKTRLRRGLKTLRQRLDTGSGGDTRRWARGLAAVLLVHGPASTTVAAAGGLKVAVLALLAVAAGFALWSPHESPAKKVPRSVASEFTAAQADIVPGAPGAAAQQDEPEEHNGEAASGPPVMRWKIQEGAHGIPAPGTKLTLLWDRSGRPPMKGARAWVAGDLVVAKGIAEDGGNAFAVTPDRRAAWIRWNRRVKRPNPWVNEVTFSPLRNVRVRVMERGGKPLAGVLVKVSQNYTPRDEARTDANGEVAFGQLFGTPADIRLVPDPKLGTRHRWLGTVDLQRGDGEIRATIEPLEEFTIDVRHPAGGGFSSAPRVDVYRAMPVGLKVDADAGRISFRARRIAAGRPLRATVGFDGFEAVTLEIMGAQAVCEVPVPATLAGTVVPPKDGDYKLKIERRRETSWNGWHVRARPTEKGAAHRFEFTGPPGEYRLRDELSGRQSDPFVLRTGGRVERPPFDLSHCAWVTGRVEPAPEKAIQATHVRVTFADEHGIAETRRHREGWVREGRFRVRLPGDRVATLRLESPTWAAEPVSVVAPNDEVVIRAHAAGARVEFRLVFPELPEAYGKRLSRTCPSAQLRNSRRVVQRLLKIDASNGRASIVGVEPGRYLEIRLHIQGWPTTVLRDVVIRFGDNDLGRVPVARGSRLRVRIRVPDGEGPPRIVVAAWSIDDPGNVRHGNPGHMPVVTLGGLGAGRWRVRAYVMQAKRFGFEREIEVDGQTDVELEFDLRNR